MHKSSMDLMRELLRRLPPLRAGARILDVGSLAVRENSGTYRELFDGDVEYTGIDPVFGANVDVVGNLVALVTAAPDRWEGGYDLVLSGQQLEHDPRPWSTITSMANVCKEGGHVVCIAPWEWPLHHEPDYYRFSHYGLKELLRYGFDLVGCDPEQVYSGLELPDAWCFGKKVRTMLE